VYNKHRGNNKATDTPTPSPNVGEPEKQLCSKTNETKRAQAKRAMGRFISTVSAVRMRQVLMLGITAFLINNSI